MKKEIVLLASALTSLGIWGATTQAKPAQASARYYWVKSIDRNNCLTTLPVSDPLTFTTPRILRNCITSKTTHGQPGMFLKVS